MYRTKMLKRKTESLDTDTSEQQVPVIIKDPQAEEVQQELDQQDSEILEDQISRMSQYRNAIDEDEQDDTMQFGNLVTQPFLSRSVRVPIIKVGCLRFTQMLQDYLRAYPPLTHADAYL